MYDTIVGKYVNSDSLPFMSLLNIISDLTYINENKLFKAFPLSKDCKNNLARN